MSTKASIFLTEDHDEHCYHETMEKDSGYDRVYLEISSETLTSIEEDGHGGYIIGLNGASELARRLSLMHFKDLDTGKWIPGTYEAFMHELILSLEPRFKPSDGVQFVTINKKPSQEDDQ